MENAATIEPDDLDLRNAHASRPVRPGANPVFAFDASLPTPTSGRDGFGARQVRSEGPTYQGPYSLPDARRGVDQERQRIGILPKFRSTGLLFIDQGRGAPRPISGCE